MNLSLRNKDETYPDVLTMSHGLLWYQSGWSHDLRVMLQDWSRIGGSHATFRSCGEPLYHSKRPGDMVEMSGYVSSLLFLSDTFMYISSLHCYTYLELSRVVLATGSNEPLWLDLHLHYFHTLLHIYSYNYFQFRIGLPLTFIYSACS